MQYTTCLAWKERRRGYSGAGLEGSFTCKAIHQWRVLRCTRGGNRQRKIGLFFSPGRRLTPTAKHHKHGGFTIGNRKGKKIYITTSQSEISPVNSETLKQQHMADTQHYSVHGPVKTSLLTEDRTYSDSIQYWNTTGPLWDFSLNISKQRPFSTFKTWSLPTERKRRLWQ